MKKIILPLCYSAFLFSVTITHAKGVDANDAQRHYRATRSYYTQLVASPNPQLAELNLLMTMLPKGGDLHHHYSGAIYAETYLDWVEKHAFCVYDKDVPQKTQNDPEKAHKKYEVDTRTTLPLGVDESCLKAAAIHKNNTFYRDILMNWSDKDYDNHSHDESPPDQHFFDTFGLFNAVSSHSTHEGLMMLKERAKAENLQYLETMLRSAPATDNHELAPAIDNLSSESSQEAVNQALDPFADFLANDDATKKKIADFAQGVTDDAAGLDDADFTARFQTYVTRNNPPSKVFAGLYAAFAASQANPLIIAVNIVGPENGYVALRDYKLHMRMFRFLKLRFPSVRLALHAGELTLGMVPPEDLRSHIRDAVEIAGAERIGHGVDVTHEDHPDRLLETLRKKNVAIEVNLTSNAFILGVQQQAHPVTVYLRHHVPFVIATDDAGVSRNNLSGEYLLFVSRYKPSYDMLKQTVYNSIRYSFLDVESKAAQLRELDQRFAVFEAAAAKLAHAGKIRAQNPDTKTMFPFPQVQRRQGELP